MSSRLFEVKLNVESFLQKSFNIRWASFDFWNVVFWKQPWLWSFEQRWCTWLIEDLSQQDLIESMNKPFYFPVY